MLMMHSNTRLDVATPAFPGMGCFQGPCGQYTLPASSFDQILTSMRLR